MPRRRIVVLALMLAAATTAGAETLRPVALSGQGAPRGGVYDRFSVENLPIVAPVNDRGQVTFFASLSRASATEAFFLSSARGTVRVVAEGNRAPGGGTFTGFARHPIPSLNDRGAVAFAAAVSGGRAVEGIFVWTAGSVTTVALTGTPAPGLHSGTFSALDLPAINQRGDVVFLATIRRGRDTIEAVYIRTGGRLRRVVAQGDPAPAGGTFAAFGAPALNGAGAVAFAAVVEGPAVPGGIFIVERGGIRMLAGAGEDTPTGGIFAKFSERVALDETGAVAFTSLLKGTAASQAVFIVEHGRPRKVAALDDPAPGGGRFSHFGPWPAVGGGAVAFAAAVEGGSGPVGVFVEHGRGLRRVVGVGDALPGGEVVASLGLYPVVSMSRLGAVCFTTVRGVSGNGLEGVFIAEARP